MYPFVYKIEALDELRENHRAFREGGIVYAKTFAEAASKLEEYYGEKSNLYLKQLLKFRKAVESGDLDYFYADRAVQVQEVVEKIYKNN